MNEIVKPAAQWISQNVGWTALIILFIFSLFFEFSKIKLSPITALLNWIGNRLMGSLKEDIADLKTETNKQIAQLKTDTENKIKDLDDKTSATLDEIKLSAQFNCKSTQEKLTEIENKQDKMIADQIKVHVFDFARSLMNGEKRTETDFKNLIAENTTYNGLVEKHNWVNDVYTADYDFIHSEYQRCQRENGFLR